MCDLPEHTCGSVGGAGHAWTRRRFLTTLGISGAIVATSTIGRAPSATGAALAPHTPLAADTALQLDPTPERLSAAVERLLRPDIVPRSVWAPDLAPVGPLEAEQPDDVRFLLVHHTAQPNGYSEASIDRYLRDIHGFHTSPAKGWPDIAYNFLVDRFGGVWEGRTGSIDAPIKGSATGGSQGFAMLCCWLGNHHAEPPTAAATEAMTGLLAWLAHRHDIDTSAGATAEFISRGSQLHPAGTAVTTATIAGHRDMSATVCPGEFGQDLVTNSFPGTVTSLRNATLADVAPTTTTTTTTVTTTTTTAAPTSTPISSTTSSVSGNEAAAASGGEGGAGAPGELDVAGATSGEGGGSGLDWPVAGAVAVTAAAAGAAIWHQRRSVDAPPTPVSPPSPAPVAPPAPPILYDEEAETAP